MNPCPVRPGFEFGFLNEWRALQDAGWDNPGISRLWRYNLHYMDYLSVLPLESQEQIVRDWIADNPVGTGSGWEPYPTSLRVVNWCKWLLQNDKHSQAALESLALQVQHLYLLVEKHLRGNHILANAKALLFAAYVLESELSEQWRKQADQLLGVELGEQFLADGMHFELSPMYHAICLVDVLDMLNLLSAYGENDSELARQLRAVAAAGLGATEAMSHPDGDVAFFNDSAFGIAPPLQDIYQYALKLGIESAEAQSGQTKHMPDAGYIRLEAPFAIAILDCAPVGPDYVPGHAHADTLSFELSIGQCRVVVNTGTSTYEKTAERQRQRGTLAHSTVCIGNADSSEVWGGFRVGRRARPFGLIMKEEKNVTHIQCSHDGYHWMKGSPTHTRAWEWTSNSLLVADRIDEREIDAVARYHLHPDVTVIPNGPKNYNIATVEGQDVEFEVIDGDVSLIDTSYHPEFGLTIPSKCIEVRFLSGMSRIKISW